MALQPASTWNRIIQALYLPSQDPDEALINSNSSFDHLPKERLEVIQKLIEKKIIAIQRSMDEKGQEISRRKCEIEEIWKTLSVQFVDVEKSINKLYALSQKIRDSAVVHLHQPLRERIMHEREFPKFDSTYVPYYLEQEQLNRQDQESLNALITTLSRQLFTLVEKQIASRNIADSVQNISQKSLIHRGDDLRRLLDTQEERFNAIHQALLHAKEAVQEIGPKNEQTGWSTLFSTQTTTGFENTSSSKTHQIILNIYKLKARILNSIEDYTTRNLELTCIESEKDELSNKMMRLSEKMQIVAKKIQTSDLTSREVSIKDDNDNWTLISQPEEELKSKESPENLYTALYAVQETSRSAPRGSADTSTDTLEGSTLQSENLFS